MEDYEQRGVYTTTRKDSCGSGEAGLVFKPEDYYYSSARNYAGLSVPLEIIFESQ